MFLRGSGRYIENSLKQPNPMDFFGCVCFFFSFLKTFMCIKYACGLIFMKKPCPHFFLKILVCALLPWIIECGNISSVIEVAFQQTCFLFKKQKKALVWCVGLNKQYYGNESQTKKKIQVNVFYMERSLHANFGWITSIKNLAEKFKWGACGFNTRVAC